MRILSLIQLFFCFTLIIGCGGDTDLAGTATGAGNARLSTLLGNLVDSSATPVPFAKVSLTETDLDTSYETTSDSAGNYRIDGIKEGTYYLSAFTSDFTQSVLQRDLVIQYNPNPDTLKDLRLSPAGEIQIKVIDDLTKHDSVSIRLCDTPYRKILTDFGMANLKGIVPGNYQMLIMAHNRVGEDNHSALIYADSIQVNPGTITFRDSIWVVSISRPSGDSLLFDDFESGDLKTIGNTSWELFGYKQNDSIENFSLGFKNQNGMVDSAYSPGADGSNYSLKAEYNVTAIEEVSFLSIYTDLGRKKRCRNFTGKTYWRLSDLQKLSFKIKVTGANIRIQPRLVSYVKSYGANLSILENLPSQWTKMEVDISNSSDSLLFIEELLFKIFPPVGQEGPFSGEIFIDDVYLHF